MIRFTAAGLMLALVACAQQDSVDFEQALAAPDLDAGDETFVADEARTPDDEATRPSAPIRPNPELAFAIHSAGRNADLATRRALGARLDHMRAARGGEMGPSYAPPPELPAAATSTVGGTSSTHLGGGGGYQVVAQPLWNNFYEITLTEISTGLTEFFLLNAPNQEQPGSTPLLVLFHKFGSSHWDSWYNTDFVTEAVARDWYFVAPLSASTKHFGSSIAQENTQAVIDFALGQYPQIDRNRIYGVGFSMGGGTALSYAARNLDPDRGLFAAIVAHTGYGSLRHTYSSEPDDDDADDDLISGANLEIPDILDYWYGGSPAQLPFEYMSHSALDMNESGTVFHDNSMLSNLRHTSIHTWYADQDPFAYLRFQASTVFNTFLTYFGGPAFLTIVSSNKHRWATLDDVAACDWLAQHTLQMPVSGSLLADRDGVWLNFDLQQTAPGAYTRVTWAVNAGSNALTLAATDNLETIVVDTVALGIDPAAAITLDVSANDGTGDVIVLEGIAQAPTSVLRDGLSDPGWIHDPLASRLTITEPDAGLNQWTVTFN